MDNDKVVKLYTLKLTQDELNYMMASVNKREWNKEDEPLYEEIHKKVRQAWWAEQ